MAEQNIKSRIVHKHDTESNWAKATGFIPKQGEIIVYDIDSTYTYERIKIGDGITNVNSLPFSTDSVVESMNTQISGLQTSINDVSALVGDSSVSSQINTAIATKVDKEDGKGLSTNDYTTTEKNKLSGIAAGAEVNQNAFSNIVVGTTTVAADTKTDTLTIVAGSNVTITPDATNDKITIAAADVAVMSNSDIDSICI